MSTILRFDGERALSHPLGVRPQGNIFFDSDMERAQKNRLAGLGSLVQVSEEALLEVFSFLDVDSLVTLSAVSKHVRAYSYHVDLWRELFWTLSSRSLCRQSKFDLNHTSWRSATLALVHGGVERERKRTRQSDDSSAPPQEDQCEDDEEESLVSCRGVYSDILYAPYRVSGLTPTADWLGRENVDRVHWKDISVEAFVEKYEKKNKPVIITGYIEDEWKHIGTAWRTILSLARDLAHDPVMECGAFALRLSELESYVSSGLFKTDESPIFVFDAKNFQKFHEKYSQIPFFENDLFNLLLRSLETAPFRPDHKWLLVGAPGASSKWHVDPNATNAWNAVISGEKKWVLLPPHLGPPPGVQVSGDGFAVRQPVTLTEWLESGCYEDMRKLHGANVVEGTCRAGEIMFVPRGWWHCVRNSGEDVCVAVTQNYAAASSVDSVRRFLKQYAHCVSGIPVSLRSGLWKAFDSALHAAGLLDDLAEVVEVPASSPTTPSDEIQDDDDGASCCGGEVETFSFWDHFATASSGEKKKSSLNYVRKS